MASSYNQQIQANRVNVESTGGLAMGVAAPICLLRGRPAARPSGLIWCGQKEAWHLKTIRSVNWPGSEAAQGCDG